jgi:EAL domain-containing protein (putative c-di-GMP-specific phosphodiesterase class I)
MMYLKEFHIDIIRFDSVYARHMNEESYQNILHGLNIAAHLCGASTWIGTLENEQSDTVAQQLKINYRSGNYLEKLPAYS